MANGAEQIKHYLKTVSLYIVLSESELWTLVRTSGRPYVRTSVRPDVRTSVDTITPFRIRIFEFCFLQSVAGEQSSDEFVNQRKPLTLTVTIKVFQKCTDNMGKYRRFTQKRQHCTEEESQSKFN